MDSDFVMSRRTLLQRAAVVLAGFVGLQATGGSIESAVAGPRRARPKVLSGIEWHYWPADGSPNVATGEIATLSGILVDAAGKQIGVFRGTSALVLGAVVDQTVNAAVQQHTFTFADGTLIGAGVGGEGTHEFAVVGGTGRYARATGSYTAVQSFYEMGGTGTATLTFDVT